PQRREIRHRLEERAAELVPVGPDLRDPQLPSRERLAHTRHLLAEAPLCRPGRNRVAVDRREDVEPQLPALPWCELEPVNDLRALDRSAVREDHLGPRASRSLLEHELVVLVLVPPLDGGWQRLRAGGVAEREVMLLDREDVREVGAQLERELAG